MSAPLHVVFVTPEIVPFMKTGGLADVSGALPKALAHLGHRVTAVVPRYREIDTTGMELRGSANIPLGGGARTATYYATRSGDVEFIFVDHPPFFDREFPYGVGSVDYPDNAARFAFFARAAIEYFRSRGQRPDLFHGHDWQAGLVPVYLKSHYADDPTLKRMASVFTIHNLAYQGTFGRAALAEADLPAHLGTPEALEFYGRISYLKGGVMFAERVNTVSPEYAHEIQRPETGYGFDGLLRARAADLAGILNGVDYEEWDPRHDPHLARPYSREALAGKAECKSDLLKTFRLPTRPGLPVIGILSRLVSQKGFDLVAAAGNELLRRPIRMVVVGTGDGDVQAGLSRLAAQDPRRFAVRFAYDPVLAHKLVAGADMLLLPSRYEPCGLTQMYALRYGTVPVVRATGGLVDTVEPFDAATGGGTGFRFEPATKAGLLAALDEALAVYEDRAAWTRLAQNGMERDFSWDHSAAAYVELYRGAIARV